MTHTILSPAKVNLFLKIVSKRPDGYHNIVSIVDIISLFDIIHMEEIPDDIVTVKDDKGVLPQGMANTMYRAIIALKKRFKISSGVHVYIEKKIPIGSGLGGPSSNAATVLRELIKLWKISVSTTELNEIGSSIGADYHFSCMENSHHERKGEAISPNLHLGTFSLSSKVLLKYRPKGLYLKRP